MAAFASGGGGAEGLEVVEVVRAVGGEGGDVVDLDGDAVGDAEVALDASAFVSA